MYLNKENSFLIFFIKKPPIILEALKSQLVKKNKYKNPNYILLQAKASTKCLPFLFCSVVINLLLILF